MPPGTERRAYKALRRRLERYENIQPQPCKRPRRRPLRRRKRTVVRFPARPGGTPGPPEPDTIIQAEIVEKCPECGQHPGKPIYITKRIIQELPDTEPVKIMGYREDPPRGPLHLPRVRLQHCCKTPCLPRLPTHKQVREERLRTDHPAQVRGKTTPGQDRGCTVQAGTGHNQRNRPRTPPQNHPVAQTRVREDTGPDQVIPRRVHRPERDQGERPTTLDMDPCNRDGDPPRHQAQQRQKST